MTVALRQRPLARVVMGIVKANNGAWFDPSDLSTLYQDAAGTIPVTAVEQPVGKILDKSGKGNHATQSITASRPTLSARKNILLATETLATQSVTTLAAQHTLSFTGTGSVTLSGTATGTLTGPGVNDRVSLTVTPTAGTLTLTVSGSVTKAQLELGASAGPYQRVNTATDYDTNPALFPKYLKFDGIDDYLNLPYMGLYANGSASVVVGMSSSSSTQRYISEASTTNFIPVYNSFRNSNGNIGISAINDSGVALVANLYKITPFVTKIYTIIDDGGVAKVLDNAVVVDSKSYTRSGSTLTLNSTAIGASVSILAGGYASMKLYGLIITKSALTDAQRVRCERFLAQKAGVML